jgi:hypothetical protein
MESGEVVTTVIPVFGKVVRNYMNKLGSELPVSILNFNLNRKLIEEEFEEAEGNATSKLVEDGVLLVLITLPPIVVRILSIRRIASNEALDSSGFANAGRTVVNYNRRLDSPIFNLQLNIRGESFPILEVCLEMILRDLLQTNTCIKLRLDFIKVSSLPLARRLTDDPRTINSSIEFRTVCYCLLMRTRTRFPVSASIKLLQSRYALLFVKHNIALIVSSLCLLSLID